MTFVAGESKDAKGRSDCDKSLSNVAKGANMTTKDVVRNGASLRQCDTKNGSAGGGTVKHGGNSGGNEPLSFANQTNNLNVPKH